MDFLINLVNVIKIRGKHKTDFDFENESLTEPVRSQSLTEHIKVQSTKIILELNSYKTAPQNYFCL